MAGPHEFFCFATHLCVLKTVLTDTRTSFLAKVLNSVLQKIFEFLGRIQGNSEVLTAAWNHTGSSFTREKSDKSPGCIALEIKHRIVD